MSATAVLARARVLVATALVVFLGACSGTTFVYNRLDTILPWYVDDYVDLDRGQETQLDALLQPFLAWHRLQELPRYIQLIDDLQSRLDRPLTAAGIAQMYAGMEVAWLRLEKESLDWLLELGGTLSDEQVQQFLDALQEQQLEYEGKYLSRTESEYREETYDNFTRNMEDYLGTLTEGQRGRLERASAAMERADVVWLQERAAWQGRLSLMLQRKPGWQERVREAVAARGETVSERYREVYEHNLQVIFAAVADVLNSSTEKQSRHLREELAMLRADLQTLVAQGQGLPAPADAG